MWLDEGKIRLASDAYRVHDRVFSVTIATRGREGVFSDRSFARECIEILRRLRDETGCRVYAYCLMPDHSHLLVGVTSKNSLMDFVKSWKSLCYRARHRRGRPERFWQRSFYDHAIRSEGDVRAAAIYILGNPVRAGLAEEFRGYPLCGSMEFDL